MDVNEQNLCADHEELTITATIAAKGGVLLSSQTVAEFADGVIVFESIPDGDYTCVVTVLDENGPLESTPLTCRNCKHKNHVCLIVQTETHPDFY